MTVTGRAMTRMPQSMDKVARIWPATVRGYMSPYPTVAMVTMAHHMACGMDWNGDSSVTRSHTSAYGPCVNLDVNMVSWSPSLTQSRKGAMSFMDSFVHVYAQFQPTVRIHLSWVRS